MNRQLWTASNFLSILRILLVIPIALLILSDGNSSRFYAVGLICIAALTDLFDGMLARRFNQITDLGKIIDPLADKIAVILISVILTLKGKIAPWFLIVVMLRDMLIFFGGMYIRQSRGILLQSTKTGKWAVTAVTAYILLTVLDLETFENAKVVLMFASILMLIVSFALYLKRFIDVMTDDKLTDLHKVTLL